MKSSTAKSSTSRTAAKVAGVSKQALLRWIAENRDKDAAKRDRNGWLLFTYPEVREITRFAQDGS